VEGLGAQSYGESFADVYDEWYGDVSDVEGTVATVVALAGGGPVLELGIGTGRLALPLAARGLEVHGIDASPSMVARLRAKPGGEDISVTISDFADVQPDGPTAYRVVLAAYNTLFNLTTAEAQRRCFVNAARRLVSGGAFVVEAFVPSAEPDETEGQVTPSVIESERVVLQVTRRHPRSQTVEGSTISISEGGVRLRPWHIRYARPAELDAMASAAGLVLASRDAGWRGEPFHSDSSRHVSVYRLAGPSP
jgi:SAM-dependent methyltransferase